MSTLKRLPVKFIRDYIKKDYIKADCCYVCGDTSNLELHHLYGLSELFNKWCLDNKISDKNIEDDILTLRATFYEACIDKLDNTNLVTLCKKHHLALHTIYGQRYSNHLVPKIKNWLEIQKDKNER